MRLLELLARHGRLALVAGLIAGILVPRLADLFRPMIAPFIVTLLFLAVLRLGQERIEAGLNGLRAAIGLGLVLQLVLPLVAALVFAAFGMLDHPLAMAIVLVLAAPPITGSPNIAIIMGFDPGPALRQLVLGTAMLPLTVLPVFLVLPALGSLEAIAQTALGLLALIVVSAGAAYALLRSGIVRPDPRTNTVVDGGSALLLGLVVVGLMSAVGPAAVHDRTGLFLSLAVAFTLNLCLQVAAHAFAARRDPRGSAAIGIVAGNRNAALFLGVLPEGMIDDVLLFIGCYQVPMYLTPYLMTRWYGRTRTAEDKL